MKPNLTTSHIFANAVGMSQSWVRDIETKGQDTAIPEKYTAIIILKTA
ncbi:hypothetical protein QHH11_12855 [Aphanizomenon sp. PH219]|uniref:XRE family transcriptional regulator n=1 Tax=Dolichospermum heterosporum TAC447 TaxID=747523 RepID=A0ABY5LYX2_9CYAN|nr:hypothetical protein [Dolichospermum heterosporum]MDK2460011.1 hypothetical protein [Aphanizomenon sp. PH219]UUO15947.1 hypothetical protein NG743_02500 [Dolichospermum heterosporum TAC447]